MQQSHPGYRWPFLAITAVALAGGLQSVCAQEPPAPAKWETTAYTGLTLTRGNSDTFLGTVSLDTKRKWPKDELALGISAAYGKVNSVENQKSVYGFGQYNRMMSDRFYFGARLDALYDGITGVDYRVKLSPLAGYYLIKEAKTSLAFETGPSVVFEKLRGAARETYLGVRFGERFEHKFTDTTKLWQTLEYLPQVDRWVDKYLLTAELGVDAAITKKVGLRTVLQDIYDSEPSPGRKKNDVRLIAGITYKF
jgi:putative salt-induced outer membrane protein YdiY